MHDTETLIIGAGVVGLAIARKLSMAGHDVTVLEQHKIIGSETSARNSEVIHAGIYYPKDSLKAQTCVDGKKQLYEFCQSHGLPHKKIGKIIVAATPEQSNALKAIRMHAEENGVTDLRKISASEVRELEPDLQADCGLLSPSTGIIDSHAYMLALQGDSENHGCQYAFNTKAENWKPLKQRGFEIAFGGGNKITCRNLIVSAGLHASNFLNTKENNFAPPTFLAKGNYFKFAGRAPFSRLIYPVPEPGGLGVHLTLDMNEQARFGPDVEWVDEIDYQVDPSRSDKFYSAIRNYWPNLPDNSLQADYCGIRPKLAARDEPNADFCILDQTKHGYQGLIGLMGMESPGLTASLAIADIIHKKL